MQIAVWIVEIKGDSAFIDEEEELVSLNKRKGECVLNGVKRSSKRRFFLKQFVLLNVININSNDVLKSLFIY